MVALEFGTRLPSEPLVIRSLCTEYPDAAASRLYNSAAESLLLVVVSSGSLLIGLPEPLKLVQQSEHSYMTTVLPRGLTSRVKFREDIVLWCKEPSGHISSNAWNI